MPPKKPVKTNRPKDLVLPEFTRYFFLLAILVVIGLFFWVISPFFNILIYAALIAVIFTPMHNWISKRCGKFRSLAAFLSTAVVVLMFWIPMTLFGILLAQEAVSAYQLLVEKLAVVNLDFLNLQRLNELPWIGEPLQNFSVKYGFQDFFASIEIDLYTLIQDAGEALSTFIVNQTGAIVFSLGTTVMYSFILTLTVFFFFRDGDDVIDFIKEISPLPTSHEDEIETKLRETTYGIAIGNFGTSMLQGVMGGLGFAIAGVDNVIFWTSVMIFGSLIPYIGASIVWAPVALSIILFGEVPFWGWFLGLWGFFVVSSVDNFVRPILIGGSAKMHPLSTFLVVLGGILIFGIKGIIFGPLILGLTITILHIYQLEYKDILKN
jgi:predicted PurR-regulated permease PerM